MKTYAYLNDKGEIYATVRSSRPLAAIADVEILELEGVERICGMHYDKKREEVYEIKGKKRLKRKMRKKMKLQKKRSREEIKAERQAEREAKRKAHKKAMKAAEAEEKAMLKGKK